MGKIEKFVVLFFIALVFLITVEDANAAVPPCNVGDIDGNGSIDYMGDVNQDGQVDNADAVPLSNYIAGTTILNQTQRYLVDVNGDFEYNNTDLQMINEYIAGNISTFPTCNTRLVSGDCPLHKGDVNGDGQVGIIDALFIAQYTVGSRSLTADQLARGNVTSSDLATNIVDALFIAQYTVGNRNSFDICVPTGGLIPCGRLVNQPPPPGETEDFIDESKPCDLCAAFYMLKNIINFATELAVGIAVFIIVIAGLIYAFSAGEPGKIELAKSAITYALTGLALIFAAWLVIAIILQSLGYADINTWNQVNCNLQK